MFLYRQFFLIITYLFAELNGRHTKVFLKGFYKIGIAQYQFRF